MVRDIIRQFTVENQYKKGINEKKTFYSEKKNCYIKKKVINQYKKGINDKIIILF